MQSAGGDFAIQLISVEPKGWDTALSAWREQSVAHFGRRAHAHFGRGFVLIDSNDQKTPVYVTHLLGAPAALFEEVQQYAPDRETVLVSADQSDADVLIVRRIRIEPQQ